MIGEIVAEAMAEAEETAEDPVGESRGEDGTGVKLDEEEREVLNAGVAPDACDGKVEALKMLLSAGSEREEIVS